MKTEKKFQLPTCSDTRITGVVMVSRETLFLWRKSVMAARQNEIISVVQLFMALHGFADEREVA